MVIQWAGIWSKKYPVLRLLFAIPNGAYKSRSQAAKFQREGLKPGVPDLFLPVVRPPVPGLFIEMKRIKGGRISLEQAEWHAALKGEGYDVVVAAGALVAIEAIASYLKLPASTRP